MGRETAAGGAVGRHGSIAVIERFWRTLKELLADFEAESGTTVSFASTLDSTGSARSLAITGDVVIGDGEMQEGAVWEAAMAGAKWKLDNLTAILDLNGLQNDDFVVDTMPIDPVTDKWRAFNWHVIEIDGVTDGYHGITHHGNLPDRLRQLRIIDAFYIEQMARFMSKLKNTKKFLP